MTANIDSTHAKAGDGITPEFIAASGRAAIRALRGLEQTAIMLERWAPECFPAGEDGKVHFARALMESAAEEIRKAWKTAIDETVAATRPAISQPEK